jgi:hypothetical protein
MNTRVSKRTQGTVGRRGNKHVWNLFGTVLEGRREGRSGRRGMSYKKS